MAFGMKKKRFKAPRVATVVGEGTEIEGNLHFTGGLHVDGIIRGNVSSDPSDDNATLTLSEHGTILGDVKVSNAFLNGSVTGDVHAVHRVELAPKARVNGTVCYDMLEMAMGAAVNGKLVHVDEFQQVQALEAPPAEGAAETVVAEDDVVHIRQP